MKKLDEIKLEKEKLENLLSKKTEDPNALNAYNQLKPYFDKVDNMKAYQPIGRIRLERLFLETSLSNDKELFSTYSKFSILAEGFEI